MQRPPNSESTIPLAKAHDEIKFLLHLYEESYKALETKKNPFIVERLKELLNKPTATSDEVIDTIVKLRELAYEPPKENRILKFFSSPDTTCLLLHAMANHLVKTFSTTDAWRFDIEKMKKQAFETWEQHSGLMMQGSTSNELEKTLARLSRLHRKLFSIGVPDLALLMGHSAGMEADFVKLYAAKNPTTSYKPLNHNDITCEEFYDMRLKDAFRGMSYQNFKKDLPKSSIDFHDLRI